MNEMQSWLDEEMKLLSVYKRMSPRKDQKVNFVALKERLVDSTQNRCKHLIGLMTILEGDKDADRGRVEAEGKKKARKYERYIYGLCSMSLINVYRLKYIGKSLPIPELVITKFNFYGERMIIQRLREDLLEAIEKQMRKIPCPSYGQKKYRHVQVTGMTMR